MVLDNLKNKNLYIAVNSKFESAFAFIEKAVAENFPVGKYEIDGKKLYASVQEYNTKPAEDGKFEGHKNYIDIQYVISGIESVELVDIGKVQAVTEYDSVKDCAFYADAPVCQKCVLQAGEYGIFFPHDIHKPGLAYGSSSPVKKIVVKVSI